MLLLEFLPSLVLMIFVLKMRCGCRFVWVADHVLSIFEALGSSPRMTLNKKEA